VRKALAVQFSTKPSSIKFDDKTITSVASRFPKWKCPSWDDQSIHDRCRTALLSAKETSDPGYPLNLVYSTNKQAVEAEFSLLLEIIICRVKVMISTDLSEIPIEDLHLLGIRDAIRPFLKKEPHALRKLKENRFRVISGIGLIDQSVERVLFSVFNEGILSNYPTLDALLGIGFTDDMDQKVGEVFSEFIEQAPDGRVPVTSDISGWDRCMSKLMTTGFSDVVYILCSNPSPELRLFLTNWVRLSTDTLVALPCGLIISKGFEGHTVSGSYETTVWNGIVRLLCAATFGNRAKVQGDDCIELAKDFKLLIDQYNAVGLPVRDVVEQSGDSFTFCSHHYVRKKDKWTAKLLSWPKALYKLLCSPKPDEELLAAFLQEVRHDPVVVKRVISVYSSLYSTSD
jgi:hypothetical protein